MMRKRSIAVLSFVSLILNGCVFNLGDPVEQAWLVNQSSKEIVVQIPTHSVAVRFAPRSEGLAYEGIGYEDPMPLRVVVLTAECDLLGEVDSEKHLLLVTVRPDLTLVAEQGANLSDRSGRAPMPTTLCPAE